MNSVVFLIPYYGKVPSYIEAFLHSLISTENFADFILFSDKEFCKEIESMNASVNFRCVSLTWERLCEKIKNLGVKPPFFAYKICDYRPLFGLVFEEFVKGYKYWGYCDVDLVMGNIEKYLKQNFYQKYDRFGPQGHFTIYKNNEKVNNLWRESCKEKSLSNFRFVQKTTYPCNFDEIGMNVICRNNGVSFFDKRLDLNTTIDTLYLHTREYRDFPQLFTWENGSTYTYVRDGKKIKKIESMYIHFMWTKDLAIQEELGNKFLITHKGFFAFDEDKIELYFEKYGKVEPICQRRRNMELVSKKIRVDKITKLCREFRTVKFRAFYNLICRLLYVLKLF